MLAVTGSPRNGRQLDSGDGVRRRSRGPALRLVAGSTDVTLDGIEDHGVAAWISAPAGVGV
ncbi:MAG TPA: hypothetical protein VFI00_10735 [Kribbella sp.]|nr:hypothetical protein [Kribbella sp.]